MELQRVQTEKEILKVRLLEQKMTESPTTAPQYPPFIPVFVVFDQRVFLRDIERNDYEKFIRNELAINIDQANRLIK